MLLARGMGGRGSVGPYHPSSFFNRKIVIAPGQDQLAQDQSPAANFYIQSQGNVAASGSTPGLSPWPYSITFISVGSTTHVVYAVRPSDASQNVVRQKVGLYYTSGSTVYLYGPDTGGAALQTYLLEVPIPDSALCPKITGSGNYSGLWVGPTGGDMACFIWDLDTDEGFGFWTFYNGSTAAQKATGAPIWTAKWGEYIPSMSNFNGVFTGTQDGVAMTGLQWGERACGLGEIGGLITQQDTEDVFYGGTINHALAFACAWTGTQIVAPAVRSDTRGGPYPVNEGTRLRLNPNADLSGITHPMGLAIARAAQTYGIVCMDSSANVGGTGGIGFYIEDDHAVGSPYDPRGAGAPNANTLNWSGEYGVYNGFQSTSADTVVNHIPWNELQVLAPVAS